jgi:CelD/BcsL family acetyltransferase involved in cellulose biosynthesis
LLRTIIARSAEEIRSLASPWERLQACGGTLFQGFAWNWMAARTFASRETPYVVYVEGDSGAAIIPAALTDGGARLTLLGERLFDYRDVLHAGDRDVLAAAWAEIAKLDLPLSFAAIRGEAGQWGGFAPRFFCFAPAVRTADIAAEDFRARHSGAARRLRHLSRLGAQLRLHSGADADLLRAIYHRKAAQFAGSDENLFRDPARVEFMVGVAATDTTACEIFTLETPGELVAALVTFRDAGTRRFYTVTYEHSWAQHSPGTALLYEVTCRSLAHALDCDYMTGEQPHKTRFRTTDVPLLRVELSAAALSAAVETLARPQARLAA